MAVYDLLHDGQAQPGPLLVLAPGVVRFVESVPDQLQILLGDADAGVLDGDEQFILFHGSLHLDDGVVVAELDRIVQQVVEHLLDFFHIRVHVHLVPGENHLDGDGLLPAGPLKGRGGAADDAVDVEIRPLQEHPLGVQVVQGQQAVGELGEALRLGEDDVQVLVMHLRRDGAVDHGLQVASDGGQGGAEVVGHIGHEFLLVVLRAGNLAGHVVQAHRQVADFIVALHLEFIVHVPGGVLLRGIGDLPQGNVHHLREEDQDDQGQEQQDDQSDVGDVQHPVAGILDPQHVAVDDHIALHHVLEGDGGEDAEHLRVEVAEEIVHHVVGAAGGRGVEIIDDNLVFHIQGGPRVQHQAA